MKFIVVLLSVVFSIQCREVPDQLVEDHEPEDEMMSAHWNSAIERAMCGRPSALCTLAGGVCINRGDECEGIKDPSGCRGKRCACCAPIPEEQNTVGCPVEDGFFTPTDSLQCFKFFPEPGRTWSEAFDLCASYGLVMAHPYNALGSRDYLLQRYGRWGYVWVNACGDDSEIIWQDNGKMLGKDSPLWRPNEPKNLTSDYCMVLSASDVNWQNIPDQIYSVYSREDKFQVLCELPQATPKPIGPKCPDGFFKTTGSSQCYKFFGDKLRNGSQAQELCNAENLTLAEPSNPVEVRSYLVNVLGNERWVYLGAKGDDSTFVWLSDGEAISNTSPYWFPGQPKYVSTDRCLQLMSHTPHMESNPDQPFNGGPCSWFQYTLCETTE